MKSTFLDKFWARVDVRGPDECWLWTGSRSSHGYGVVSKARGKYLSAHRFSWELHNAREIPDGMAACHACDVKLCVNGAHLWIGTNADNMKDAAAKLRRPEWAEVMLRPQTRFTASIIDGIKRLGGVPRFCRKAGIPRSTLYYLLSGASTNVTSGTLRKLTAVGVELPPVDYFYEAA